MNKNIKKKKDKIYEINKNNKNEIKIEEITTNEIDESLITIILKQTNYDKKTAIEKLKKWNNNHINVIKEYMNPNFQTNKNKKPQTNNQKIFSEIRNFMDSIKY